MPAIQSVKIHTVARPICSYCALCGLYYFVCVVCFLTHLTCTKWNRNHNVGLQSVDKRGHYAGRSATTPSILIINRLKLQWNPLDLLSFCGCELADYLHATERGQHASRTHKEGESLWVQLQGLDDFKMQLTEKGRGSFISNERTHYSHVLSFHLWWATVKPGNILWADQLQKLRMQHKLITSLWTTSKLLSVT